MNKFLNKKKSREIVIFDIKNFFFHVNDTVKSEYDSEQTNPCRKKISSPQDIDSSIGYIRIHSKTSDSIANSENVNEYNFDSDSESVDSIFEFSFVPPRQDDVDFYKPSLHSAPIIEPAPCGSNDCTSLQIVDKDKITNEFHSFMLTKGGGGRRNTPVKGDMSSFRCLMKEIGWNNLWDHNNLNSYITSATCSPSTSYCRLRVFERFVHFLRSQYPNLLPSVQCMTTIESMLKALKEALGKDRHHRGKFTMTASRDRMPHSLMVLKEWRLRREAVEVKKFFLSAKGENTYLDESLFLKLRNYLLVEILLNNAQRSGIIEGIRIREFLNAKGNANEDNLHYLYVERHKTDYIQPAIIYLDTEIFNYLLIFVTVIIPELPKLEYPRSGEDCHVFQIWLSDKLHSSNLNHCLRAGLLLYDIHDPKGCPTHYRKAASTLISMHKPELQETLSQFMCHSRATTEKHYRTHMAHKGMYSIYKELARCQALQGEKEKIVVDSTQGSHYHGLSLSSDDNESDCEDKEEVDTEESDDSSLEIQDGITNTPALKLAPPVLVNNLGEELYCHEETSLPKYSSKWNTKSIFCDQIEEDIFFRVFEKLIDSRLAFSRVCAIDVCSLAQESPEFSPIWERLVQHFGFPSASKKVTYKIRTFGRNHRNEGPKRI